MPFYTVANAEKENWLVQHVPHRICAALPWLPMQEKKWVVPRSLDVPNRNFDVWCVDRSVDEGRKAAMRWLIEFVGVIANGNGDPIAVKPHKNGKSVTIEQVGGRMFCTKSQGARKLAEIWQACTQASSHPTADTNHPPVAPHDLATALAIVIAHLENTLYKPDDRDLWKIVHDQEELAIVRSRGGQLPETRSNNDLTTR